MPALSEAEGSLREGVGGGRSRSRSFAGVGVFFAILAGLTIVRLLIAFIPAPLHLVFALSIAVTVLFVAAPIFGLFRAANGPWTPKTAVAFLIGGVALHAGMLMIGAAAGRNVAGLVCLSVAQVGLITWCVGLGGLLGTMLKDKNLLIPVTIFLGSFDLFLVFAPEGPTRIIMQAAPKILPTIGYAIPRVATAPHAVPVAPYAVVGPADFVFMAMFFIALFRFDMRARETFIALVPTLLLYLLLSGFFGAIPLLPPIALVVLVVNARQFTMNKEEKLSTLGIGLICAALIAFAATRPKPRPELVNPGPGPARPGPEGLHAPTSRG